MKKSWITKGILKSIEKKQKCFRTRNATKKRSSTTFLSPIGIILIK